MFFAFSSGYAQENSQIDNSWLDKIDHSALDNLGDSWFETDEELSLLINLPDYLRAPEEYKIYSEKDAVGVDLTFTGDDILDKEAGITEININVMLKNEFCKKIAYEMTVTYVNETVSSDGITLRTGIKDTKKGTFQADFPINTNKPPQYFQDGDDEKCICFDFYY